MSLISVSVRLDKIDESLLFKSKKGSFYLNLILLPDKDQFGNFSVIQPVGREAYAAGERAEPCGTWKQLASKSDRTKQPISILVSTSSRSRKHPTKAHLRPRNKPAMSMISNLGCLFDKCAPQKNMRPAVIG
jgi:hypothetical protein